MGVLQAAKWGWKLSLTKLWQFMLNSKIIKYIKGIVEKNYVFFQK